MKRRSVLIASGIAAVVAGVAVGGIATSQAATSPAAVTAAAVNGGAPYLFPAAGGNVNPVTAMSQTGVKAYTLAFILSKGTCNPTWDGDGALTGPQTGVINSIRGKGGDVVVSFGGFSGNKLGNSCSNATNLAAAYQKVINQYKLKAIDIDLEAGEVSQGTKVLQALKTVKQKNPGVQIIMTLGVGTGGLEGGELNVLKNAGKMGSPVDVWTIMPFDFGPPGKTAMGTVSVNASEALHKQMKSALKLTNDAQVYRMQGISSMNGKTDTGETIKQSDFNTMLNYANGHHLARFTYWTINRDRGGCGGSSDTCSGLPSSGANSQKQFDFARIVAKFTG
jgi:chitinase